VCGLGLLEVVRTEEYWLNGAMQNTIGSLLNNI
jgi:hypothetical protein